MSNYHVSQDKKFTSFMQQYFHKLFSTSNINNQQIRNMAILITYSRQLTEFLKLPFEIIKNDFNYNT